MAGVENDKEGNCEKGADRDVDVEDDGARVEAQRSAPHQVVERRQQRCRRRRPAAACRQHPHCPSAPQRNAAGDASRRF